MSSKIFSFKSKAAYHASFWGIHSFDFNALDKNLYFNMGLIVCDVQVLKIVTNNTWRFALNKVISFMTGSKNHKALLYVI